MIDGHRVGDPPRCGTVRSTSGRMLTVAWDDGHESVFVPGSDCRILPGDGPDAVADAAEERFGASVALRIVEHDGHCEAVATLMTSRGTFEGTGTARRHPRDVEAPVVGEELAIGRALRTLSDTLLAEAMATDPEREGATAHLLR